MNGYYEFKVIASTSANACDSDRGRTTTTTTTTTTNMTSSIVEVSAYELRVLFSISSVGVIVDNMSMAVSCASQRRCSYASLR